jgi:hypothetical protein
LIISEKKKPKIYRRLISTFQSKTAQPDVEPMGVKTKVVLVNGVCNGFQVRILSISNTPSKGIGCLLFGLY